MESSGTLLLMMQSHNKKLWESFFQLQTWKVKAEIVSGDVYAKKNN